VEELALRETAETQVARRAMANEALSAVAAKLGNTVVLFRQTNLLSR
jgi:hypothetical protein